MFRRIGIFLGTLTLGASLWAGGATFSRVKTWSNGDTLTAGDLNSEFNNILNNGNPAGWDDYSNTLTEMRTTEAPYPASVESQATSLQGELTRLRYQILGLKQSIQASSTTYWYQGFPTAGVFSIVGSSVGVNQVAPTYALDVNGSVRASTITVSSMTLSTYLGVPAATNFTHLKSQLSGNFSLSGGASNYEPINTWTDVTDSFSEMGATTFTVTNAGKYLVCANLIFKVTSGQVGNQEVAVYVNGVFGSSLYWSSLSAGTVATSNGCATMNLSVSDLLTIRVFGSGTNIAVTSSLAAFTEDAGESVLSIDRLF